MIEIALCFRPGRRVGGAITANRVFLLSMTYRGSEAAPAGRLAEERRGREVGRFCLACGSVYPLFQRRHQGKPSFGKDHVSSPCSHEGESFEPGADWWQPAVEVLPAPAPSDPA